MNGEQSLAVQVKSRAVLLFVNTAAMVLFCLIVLPACRAKTESDKVKGIVSEIQKAAEGKDIKTILGNVSKAYHDPQGNDYSGIKDVLRFYFYRHQKVSVYIPNMEVVVTDPSARAVFQAVLTGRGNKTPATSLLPQDLGMYTFDVSLQKEKGAWKIVSAKWEQVGAASTPP